MNLPATMPNPAEGRQPVNTASIPRWGVDAHPRNDPIRGRSQVSGLTGNWERPAIQRPDVEILQLIEHIRQPTVVGFAVYGISKRNRAPAPKRRAA